MNVTITGTNRRTVELEANWVSAAADYAYGRVENDGRWTRAIEKALVWIRAQEALVYDADTTELVGIGSTTSDRTYTASGLACQCEAFANSNPCWHRAAAMLVRRALLMKGTAQLHDVAYRLAMWQLRGWVPQSMDIFDRGKGERFATWRDTQGRDWSADLQPGENYVVLPLHCRELGVLVDERVTITPQRLERARQWIADMREFVTA